MNNESSRIVERLTRHLEATRPRGVVSAYVFGSHARGAAHRESDVDIGVLLARETFETERERFDERLRLIGELGPGPAHPVDLVVLNDAPPLLGRRIVTEGRRIFCVDTEVDHAYVRDVQLLAADLEPFLRRMRAIKLAALAVTFLVERLAELRRHLDHLTVLRPRVTGVADLQRDLSLHNDVLFSLMTVCQLVIDIAGELSSRRGERFENYSEAIRNLARDARFSETLVRSLERLPGFRNVVVHEYVALDMRRVVEALDDLAPIEAFAEIVRAMQ